MKKILISLVLIAAVSLAAVGVTRTYFFDDEVLAGNTFSTGSVELDDFTTTSLMVENLEPGVWTDWYRMTVPYIGTLNADIYAGTGGCSSPTDDSYIADVLKVYIQRGNGDYVWQGYANELSEGWKKIATNVPAGNYNYDIKFKLDLSGVTDPNVYQNRTNTDTAFIIHAVLNGYAAPETVPYLYLFVLQSDYCTTP